MRSRGSAGQYSKLYTTSRWRRLRAMQLLAEPLCSSCCARGLVTEASVVDHIEPHKGDMDKFWYGALQSLCSRCHNSDKQLLESSGGVLGCDKDGVPLNPNHHWK